MLTPVKRQGVWVLVETDSDDAGMPESIVGRFPGPLGGLRAYAVYLWRTVRWLLARR